MKPFAHRVVVRTTQNRPTVLRPGRVYFCASIARRRSLRGRVRDLAVLDHVLAGNEVHHVLRARGAIKEVADPVVRLLGRAPAYEVVAVAAKDPVAPEAALHAVVVSLPVDLVAAVPALELVLAPAADDPVVTALRDDPVIRFPAEGFRGLMRRPATSGSGCGL